MPGFPQPGLGAQSLPQPLCSRAPQHGDPLPLKLPGDPACPVTFSGPTALGPEALPGVQSPPLWPALPSPCHRPPGPCKGASWRAGSPHAGTGDGHQRQIGEAGRSPGASVSPPTRAGAGRWPPLTHTARPPSPGPASASPPRPPGRQWRPQTPATKGALLSGPALRTVPACVSREGCAGGRAAGRRVTEDSAGPGGRRGLSAAGAAAGGARPPQPTAACAPSPGSDAPLATQMPPGLGQVRPGSVVNGVGKGRPGTPRSEQLQGLGTTVRGQQSPAGLPPGAWSQVGPRRDRPAPQPGPPGLQDQPADPGGVLGQPGRRLPELSGVPGGAGWPSGPRP